MQTSVLSDAANFRLPIFHFPLATELPNHFV